MMGVRGAGVQVRVQRLRRRVDVYNDSSTVISLTTASRKRFSRWDSDGNVGSCFIQQVDHETKLSVINKKEDKREIKHTTKKEKEN